ncbi:Thioredoxin domain-containing protein 2 [Apophysomyces ossiformis]|uniref:Thioredoxin n=1 Tax=Apophysomyces ossiformis TaxID=679940 RepID=A0A8H7BI57_9FUNG|nr:Thioredoxin domain-containing protein 2 [Apophysomyces ossiformis]
MPGIREIVSFEEYKEIIATNKFVVVDFHATWCGPCKLIAPLIKELADATENQHIVFLKVNVDDAAEISQDVGIRAMPTFLFYKDGEKVNEIVGANKAKIVETVASFAA